MSYKIYLKYGHTVEKCRETTATCAMCSNQGHNNDKRYSTKIRCCHCEADHQVFSGNCPIIRRETEIIQMQTKVRIAKLQAIRKLLRLNPNPKLIFSNAVKNTSNPTELKSPTRSENESQSDSSDGTNVTLKNFENFGKEEDNSTTVPTYGLGY